MHTMCETLRLSDSSELTKAIYFVIEKLMKRGYLHLPDDVEFVRPGYKSVFPCGKGHGQEGLLDLHQLMWASERGNFWFNWYKGTHLKLCLHKVSIQSELEFDPSKQSLWEFVYFTLDSFK
jgi:hypothetical protein